MTMFFYVLRILLHRNVAFMLAGFFHVGPLPQDKIAFANIGQELSDNEGLEWPRCFSIHPSVCLSFYVQLSLCLSVCLCICPPVSETFSCCTLLLYSNGFVWLES